MSVADKLDRLQRRHRAAGFPIAVVYKYVDDSGPYLAALITYYAFVSLFPLLLLFSTVLSSVLAGDPELQQRLLDSALSQFPVVGDQLGTPEELSGGVVGVVVGILGALYGGLGVAQAVQYAMNTAWSVPRNSRPNPFLARGRSLLLLGTAGIAVLGTTALSTLGSGNAGSLGTVLRMLALVGSITVNGIVFVFAFRLATARHLTIRQVAPGALIAAVLWQLLQTFGVAYVSRVISTASATNGVFALVLGLLAFLYLAAVVGVLCVEINVVHVQRLWPRALLTPFTDDVDLTPGDRRSYTGQAKAQRQKGFETVHVTFDPPDRSTSS
ncbi:YihY/virulence factor BrkB family protein [Modestobacter versicolor]|uniref:Ribonuclease BN n=1 Tax=Modestobacter versicolor TaxID=429133 RepID=A0A323V2U4_9ACTN|nr:YihY/virulence factor BrkB family protein [Modestobacter versicolor]MBB3674463.1 YihY family inner membrane protein [Modestobacter versicolor]PZA19112.1 ribonuclease BN [Modestobacter versicolor]